MSTSAKPNNTGKRLATVDGLTYGIEGEKRFLIWGAYAFIVVLIALLFWHDASWRDENRGLRQQLEEKEQPPIIHDQCGDTTIVDRSHFHSGPSDLQISYLAKEIITKLKGSNSNDIESDYRSIRKYFTDELLRKLDGADGKAYRAAIRNEKIYRVINASIRPMRESDLPPGTKVRVTQFDIIVIGEIASYPLADLDDERTPQHKPVNMGKIGLYMHFVPTGQINLENIFGLKVDQIEDLNDLKKVFELANANSSKEVEE